MSVKHLPIYLFSILLLFLLLEIVLGSHGLLVTRDLERQLSAKETRYETELLQLRGEQERYQRLINRESLLDSALKLGLTEPGAKVYYFATSEEMVESASEERQREVQGTLFAGYSSLLLFIISWAVVSFVFLIIFLMRVRRNRVSNDY